MLFQRDIWDAEDTTESVFIGTSGFSFSDWIGTVYPENIGKSKMFEYYTKIWKFNALEVNFTYYSFPSRNTILSFMRKSAPHFLFAFKVPGSITHEIWKEDDTEYAKKEIEEFITALDPLRKARKLGGVLLQFPYSFKKNLHNLEYLDTVSIVFKMHNIDTFVEFRNSSWAVDDTFDFLKEKNIGYVIVDEPRLPGLFPYIVEKTVDTAYFRFHGRNERWFEAQGSERYDYLYSDDELKLMANDVKNVKGTAKKVFIFFNNCHHGSAVQNALKFRDLLKVS